MNALLDKPVKVVTTSGFNTQYGGIEAIMYVKMAMEILQKYPHDMLVFEMADENHLSVKLAGYHLQTGILIEGVEVCKIESLEVKTFWVKVDNYGSEYVITFLFPEEY